MKVTEVDKQNIIHSLNKLKNGTEDIDYIELRKSDCKIIGRKCEYKTEYTYDYYDGAIEDGESIVPFKDSFSSYFFSVYILENIDDFVLNLEEIISKRAYSKAAYITISDHLESLYNGMLQYERILFDIPNKKLRYHVNSAFEADEENGQFVFDANDCLEWSCIEADDGSLMYDATINNKIIENFCIDSIESYFNINLYYSLEDFIVVG